MKRTLHRRLPALLIALVAAFPCLAQVPGTISYQGRVTASGTNVHGPGQFQFALVTPAPDGARQATGLATISGGFLTIVSVTDGGSGYLTAPAVTATGGGGSGAIFTAHVSGGIVTGVTVNNPGGGYTSIPTITIAPPPLMLAFATLWSHDGTSANGGPPASMVSINVQDGLFTVLLGDTNLPNMLAIPASVFTNEDVRLRIWFADGTNQPVPLSPDQRLSSVAYAMIADNVRDGAITASKLAPGAIGSAQLAPNLTISGSVVAASFTGSGAGLSNLPLATLQGALAWQVIAGTNQQAVPNSSYLFTNDQQGTLTLPPSPPVGSSIRVASSSDGGWRVVANPGQSIANLPTFGWSSTRFRGFSWTGIASSADGSKVVAVANNGIATSTDSGVTWTLRETNSNLSLSSVASSADGSKLVAGSTSGYLYTSTDSGVSWTPRMTDVARNWKQVASSADGTKLAAASGYGGMFTSMNSGITWTSRISSVSMPFEAVAISADGTMVLAAARQSSTNMVWMSTDSGGSWALRLTVMSSGPLGNGPFHSIAMSGDGARQYAMQQLNIYRSTNFGTTWSQFPADNYYHLSLSSSADGMKLINSRNPETGDGNGLWTSENAGETWHQRQFSQVAVLTISADGTKIFTCDELGNLYRSPSSAPIGASTLVLGPKQSSIELIYTGNNHFMPVNWVGEISVE